MKDRSPHPMLRMLLGAACIVIIVAGVRATSAVLGPLLLSLLIAYAVVPFPKWLMLRFKLRKSAAIALTVVAVLAFGLYLQLALDLATMRIAARLPRGPQPPDCYHIYIATWSAQYHALRTSI